MSFFTKVKDSFSTGVSGIEEYSKDTVHRSLMGMSGRSLGENMSVYGLGTAAFGAGLGSVGGAIYGDRDTDVLAGAGIGALVGGGLGTRFGYVMKSRANAYLLGATNRLDEGLDVSGTFDPLNLQVGRGLLSEDNMHSSLTIAPYVQY